MNQATTRSAARRRLLRALAAATALAALLAGSAHAFTPDPTVGGALWAPNQAVAYTWKSGQVPPAWMTGAIDAAAADASASRASRAATFSRATGATSLVAYGEPTGCSSAGIACFDRSGAPTSFRIWFRAHGYVFDWGALRWCQALATIADGCFDVENLALDEFGHAEILGHHVNLADGSDYTDAVVQTIARARPSNGWDAHAFRRCDTARLQLEYDRPGWASPFSTCLAIPTITGLAASATSVGTGASVVFTATLRTTPDTANRALAGDPVSRRTVVLQRRLSGATTWSLVATMAPGTADGTYVLAVSPTATYEWRATFATPANEGLTGSSSGALKVTLNGCTGTGCPSLGVP